MADQPLTLEQKVVTWATGQLNKKVGAGECWDLAEEALKQAGAKTSKDLGPVDADSDYVWGTKVTNLKDVEPGHILQLRDHKVTITTEVDYTFADGSGDVATTSDPLERPHHTAIVNSKIDSDGAIKTLEQNVKPGGKVVQNQKLYTRDVAPVVTSTYEQKYNPHTKKTETATVVTTVTVTVEGTIWAYKPKS